MKNEFFDGIENNLKTRKDELSKMIERNSATQQTITYDAYDNGRGETFIEVQ